MTTDKPALSARLSLWLHTRRQRRTARKPLILLRPNRKARP